MMDESGAGQPGAEQPGTGHQAGSSGQPRAARQLGLRARWAVPAGAVLAVGAVVAGTSLAAGAQAAPALPVRTAAQLIADAQHASAPGPMTATISETASLGLPSLPSLGDSGVGGSLASSLSMLTGTHTFNLWYADPAHVRVAELVQLGESDLRVSGRQVWLWSSKTQTATHVVLPAEPSGSRSSEQHAADQGTGAAKVLTPLQAAQQVLAAVGPTTTVSVQRNVRVAGQDAYQLSVAPKDRRSLVGQIRIAIDSAKYLPLRVQVFARGAGAPALQVGFTALSFGRPAASNFAFTPPPGAKVKTVKVPAQPGFAKAGWHGSAGPGRPAAKGSGSFYPTADGAAGLSPFASFGGAGAPTVLGKDWLSVLVFRAGSSSVTNSRARLQAKIPVSNGTAKDGRVVRVSAQSGSVAYSSTLTVSPAPSPVSPAELQLLLKATTAVHGSWGSGRLLRTSLISVLMTSKGTVLVGAVKPSVLFADAAAVK